MPIAREKRNVFLLAVCQALFQTAGVVIITASGLVGHLLAADKSLATLPISAWMVGTLVTMIPASLLMGRLGRKVGFTIGGLLGVASGALAVFGLIAGSFWIFTLAHLLHGGYQGFAQFYRFAAADAASAQFKSRAISYVLSGGVVSAIVGPNLVAFTRDLTVGTPFIASYAALIVLGLAATAVVALIEIPPPAQTRAAEPPRPLPQIVRQPVFIVALLVAAIGYGVMNLAMTATPLAMAQHDHGIAATAFVIQWHVLGMFVPSFFTGAIIARFGSPLVMLAGIVLLAVHVAIAFSGIEFLYFLSALTLLGIGWNFSYIGGTTLLTEAYRPSEKALAQGVNDFTIFTTVVASSFASGALLHRFGWTGVNVIALPFLALAGIALILFLLRRRGRSNLAAAE
jgi:MFS family permease